MTHGSVVSAPNAELSETFVDFGSLAAYKDLDCRPGGSEIDPG
jgi:hypothetical protein